MQVSAIEGLLESFATDALGIELHGRLDLKAFPRRSISCEVSGPGTCARIARHTNRGVATFCAVYDEVQSLKATAQVVKIAWWIGSEHHEGWWHRYPKFPRDWIKGIGRTVIG